MLGHDYVTRITVMTEIKRSLIVLNYAMDSRDPIFSHQVEVVRKLAPYFSKVEVVTNSYSEDEPLPQNVQVHVVGWHYRRKVRNVLRFIKTFRDAQKGLPFPVIFSHMTEVQSAIIAPYARFKGIPHYLWYAHTSKSTYLRLCHFFTSAIITSTPGSCPIRSNKVIPIGQGIDEAQFPNLFRRDKKERESLTSITVGRVDPSKKVDELLRFVCEGVFRNYFESFFVIGTASKGNEAYEATLHKKYQTEVYSSKVRFVGAVTRNEISNYLRKSDLFLHAFNGSLDKSLVEATLSGIPVITTNAEYHKEFGTWTSHPNKDLSLEEELSSFLKKRDWEVAEILNSRRQIGLVKHSLSQWIESLRNILQGSRL